MKHIHPEEFVQQVKGPEWRPFFEGKLIVGLSRGNTRRFVLKRDLYRDGNPSQLSRNCSFRVGDWVRSLSGREGRLTEKGNAFHWVETPWGTQFLLASTLTVLRRPVQVGDTIACSSGWLRQHVEVSWPIEQIRALATRGWTHSDGTTIDIEPHADGGAR